MNHPLDKECILCQILYQIDYDKSLAGSVTELLKIAEGS